MKTQTRQRGTGRFVGKVTPCDILCGKSRECLVHEGTKKFRAVIEAYKDSYAKALTKVRCMESSDRGLGHYYELALTIGCLGPQFYSLTR